MADECERRMEDPASSAVIDQNLRIIRQELVKLGEHPNLYPFAVEYLDALENGEFDTDLYTEVSDYLTYARIQFQDINREASIAKDQVTSRLVDSLGSDAVYRMRQQYTNNKLTEHVTNRMEVNKIIQVGNKLVQKKDPIYFIPDSETGRAHYYAPYKRFNRQLYETKWFNLSVIWVFSFILYVTLLLDVLRRIITYFNSIRLSRQG